jgi:uncharacterized membrane protein
VLEVGIMWTAMLFIVLGFWKLVAAWILHRNPSSALGHGIDWFFTPAA